MKVGLAMVNHLPLKHAHSNTLYKILDASFDLFISQGIFDTTITDIARKANLSRGGVRRYFENPILILNTLCLEIFEVVDAEIYKITLNSELSFEEKLIELSEFFSNNKDYFLLFYQADTISRNNQNLASFSARFASSRSEFFDFFKNSVLEEQKTNKHFQTFPAEDIAISLFSLFESMYLFKLPPNAHYTKAVFANSIKLFLR